MTRLEELYHSLATVLIRYHDIQRTNPLVKGLDPYAPNAQYHQKTASILKDKGFAAELDRLNFECKGQDKDRLESLTYIKDVVLYLHTLNQRTEPFSESELEKYELLIVQLLTDLKTLLTIDKSITYKATLARVDGSTLSIPLKGLLDSGYVANTLCASGKVIQQEVLSKFEELTEELTDEAMREFSADLCREHDESIRARKSRTDDLERRQAEQLAKEKTAQLELVQGQNRTLQEQVASLLEVQEGMKAKVEAGEQAQLDLISVRAAHAELQSQFESQERKQSESATTILSLQHQLEAAKLELRLSEGSKLPLQLSEGGKKDPSYSNLPSFLMPPTIASSLLSQEHRRITKGAALPFQFYGKSPNGTSSISPGFFAKSPGQPQATSSAAEADPLSPPTSNAL